MRKMVSEKKKVSKLAGSEREKVDSICSAELQWVRAVCYGRELTSSTSSLISALKADIVILGKWLLTLRSKTTNTSYVKCPKCMKIWIEVDVIWYELGILYKIHIANRFKMSLHWYLGSNEWNIILNSYCVPKISEQIVVASDCSLQTYKHWFIKYLWQLNN